MRSSSLGTALVSSEASASPRAFSSASVSRSTSSSQRAPSSVMPAPSSSWIVLLRSTAAMAVVHAAWTTGISSTGTTNIVRRMPSMRISERSSYSACSIAVTSGVRMRAAADRNTVAASVACNATRFSATARGLSARQPHASRWRWPSRARRSSVVIFGRAVTSARLTGDGDGRDAEQLHEALEVLDLACDAHAAACERLVRAHLGSDQALEQGPGMDHQVGTRQWARADVEGPVGNARVDRQGADVQLIAHVHRVRRGGLERGHERQAQRVDGEHVIRLGIAQRLGAPATKQQHDVFELGAIGGQLVNHTGRRPRQHAAAHDANLLELLQPGGQNIGRNAWQTLAQLGEALGPEDQVANDQQRPALAHELEGAGEAAELVIAPTGHATNTIPRLTSRTEL